MALTIGSFLVVMSILVFVHELGHFLVAKRNGIVVEEFGFGYPPRVAKLAERNGTIYSINAIPFGGFVRMRGEDDPSLSGSFAAASRRARTAVLLAGAAMNFLLAIVLFATLTMITGMPDVTKPGAVVEAVSSASPAEAAGLQPGDRIIAVGDSQVITLQDLQDDTAANAGKPAVYKFVRTEPSGASRAMEVTMVPRANPPKNQGALGIRIGESVRRATVFEAAWNGIRATGDVVYMTFKIPAMLIREGKPIGDMGFMGPVGIAVTTGDVVRSAMAIDSLQPILTFVALLSAALGITNLLPIPALDGGRLLFVVIEAIRRKRIEPAQEGLVHLVGFGLLLILVGLVTVHEISSLVAGTFPSIGIR